MNMSNGKSTVNQEYENESHLGRKKKAIESQFQKKNFKQIVDLMDEEDVELAQKYAQYIR